MEFLKEIAIPQSLEHFRLVLLIVTLSAIVFLPSLGYILGSSIVSVWYNRKGRTEGNALFLQVARDLIDTALYSKSLILFLTILPGMSLVLAYAQILQGTPSLGVGLAGFGFLFLVAAMILLFSYKYTFQVQELLGSYQKLLRGQEADRSQVTVAAYEKTNTRAHTRSGYYGTSFLFAAVVLYAAAFSVTANPSNWEMESVLYLFISPDVWMKVLEMLVLTTGITGVGMLFFSFAGEYRKEHTDEYSALVKKAGIRLSVLGLLLLPLFVLFSTAAYSDAALSGIMYSLMGTAIMIFFLSAHFVYGYVRSLQASALTIGFMLFLLATSMVVFGDTIAIATATRSQAVLLASAHDKEIEKLKSSFGVMTVTFNGEDIYNAKCSACHLFDQKKVGPPYETTIPKYEGKKAELIAFVLNPVKKDPAYPPMPNQGLRPAEADSIVSYILRKVAVSVPPSAK